MRKELLGEAEKLKKLIEGRKLLLNSDTSFNFWDSNARLTLILDVEI